MASKSELLNAQSFSRRRLLTAFISGAPGGRELEPAKPLRGVIAGIALSVVVVLVGLFMGFLQKGLPDGWGNGHLIIDQSTGSRYVTIENELWPVLNVASARLMLTPDASNDPIVTNSNMLQDFTVRDTIGIPGAPDTMPVSSKLINTEWAACIADNKGAIDARISSVPIAEQSATGQASVVTSNDRIWVISGSLRMEVPAASADRILRDIGLSSAAVHPVTTNWLNLFEEGDALAPLQVSSAGTTIAGTQLRVGDIVFVTTDLAKPFVVQSDKSLAELTPLAYALYQHGKSYSEERTFELSPADTASLPNAAVPLVSPDWPEKAFSVANNISMPCALTVTSAGKTSTVLAMATDPGSLTEQASVEPGTGALVSVAGFGQDVGAMTVLIDATTTAFAIPVADDALLAKLGYLPTDVGAAPAPWLALFKGGPELTEAAAGVPNNESTR